MQTTEDLDKFYETEDPWKFKTNSEDFKRKWKIIDICYKFAKHSERALDIGCGEGWITQIIRTANVYGFELSEKAKKRWSAVIKDFDSKISYDLVIATGVLYKHYEYELFHKMIETHSSNIVVTCNIKDWEVPFNSRSFDQIHYEEFPYREYTQALRVFKKKVE